MPRSKSKQTNRIIIKVIVIIITQFLFMFMQLIIITIIIYNNYRVLQKMIKENVPGSKYVNVPADNISS
jgi:hypothetical protein